jgi:hypothetical protein
MMTALPLSGRPSVWLAEKVAGGAGAAIVDASPAGAIGGSVGLLLMMVTAGGGDRVNTETSGGQVVGISETGDADDGEPTIISPRQPVATADSGLRSFGVAAHAVAATTSIGKMKKLRAHRMRV